MEVVRLSEAGGLRELRAQRCFDLHGRRLCIAWRMDDRLSAVAAAYANFAKERPHQFRILVEPPNEPAAPNVCVILATVSIQPDRGSQPRIDPVDQPEQAAAPEAVNPCLVAAIEHDVAELRKAPAQRDTFQQPELAQ